jgi:hypothetical protein
MSNGNPAWIAATQAFKDIDDNSILELKQALNMEIRNRNLKWTSLTAKDKAYQAELDAKWDKDHPAQSNG